MSTQVVQNFKTPYDLLLFQVRKTLIEGQRRVEEEKLRTYWETGQYIYKHILKHSDRAEYGGEVIHRLVNDLKADKSTLYHCLAFAKAYSKFPIVYRGRQFKWRHFRALSSILDEKVRKRLEEETQRNAWTGDELLARIKAQKLTMADRKSSAKPHADLSELLKPLRGELFTYQIIDRPTLGLVAPKEPGLLLDLGFGVFRDLDFRVTAQFKAGDIVQSKSKDEVFKFTPQDSGSAKDLFTYQAVVEKVIDGDTLKVRLDLGFGTWKKETLRLRGIDCPELSRKEGVAAKTFVQTYIKEAEQVIVRSTRDDKYGRYLADVFIPVTSSSKGDEVYLNNLLLESGHAVRMQ